MMHGREKSGSSIVAVKSANEGGRPPEESMEPREGAEGNANQHGIRRTPSRGSMFHALIAYGEATICFAVKYPRWEPYAGNPHVRFCAGGAQ